MKSLQNAMQSSIVEVLPFPAKFQREFSRSTSTTHKISIKLMKNQFYVCQTKQNKTLIHIDAVDTRTREMPVCVLLVLTTDEAEWVNAHTSKCQCTASPCCACYGLSLLTNGKRHPIRRSLLRRFTAANNNQIGNQRMCWFGWRCLVVCIYF